jgi:hypothetical protein
MNLSNLLGILRVSTQLFISVLMDARRGRQHIKLSHLHTSSNFSYTPLYSIIYFLPLTTSSLPIL